ncbi:MAG: VCBS repeat-containing protein, partial [Verrucomicrobiota bacterium]
MRELWRSLVFLWACCLSVSTLWGEVEGRRLAEQHCANCHQFPEPDLLPERSWRYMLSYMGFFLGVEDYDDLEGESDATLESIHARAGFVREAGMFPGGSLISEGDWALLKKYYFSNARDAGSVGMTSNAVAGEMEGFRVWSSQYEMDTPLTSLVYVDESSGHVLLHDGRSERLTILDKRLRFFDSHPAPGVSLVDAVRKGEDALYLLSIGDLFASNIGKGFGEIQRVKVYDGIFLGLDIQLDGLHRPADFAFADMNEDGVEDVLVSNFGDYTGNFTIYLGEREGGGFKPEGIVLSEQPGIVKGEPYDFDGDGRLDVAVLMSAARENMSVFLNRGSGRFEREILWEAHSAFGYVGFELRDFDGDGRID